MAAVSLEEIEHYRASGRTGFLPADGSFSCSHCIAYWVTHQPLGRLLGDAIDLGELLRDDLWHPLRPPIVVPAAEVRARLDPLEAAFSIFLGDLGLTEASDDWYVHEIGQVLGAYRQAAATGAAVVSAIEPPMDAERADRVMMPLELRR